MTEQDVDSKILARLERTPLPETVKAFANELGISRPTMANHINQLISKGKIWGPSAARLRHKESIGVVMIASYIGDTEDLRIRDLVELLSSEEYVAFFYPCGGSCDYVIGLRAGYSQQYFTDFATRLYSFRLKTDSYRPTADSRE